MKASEAVRALVPADRVYPPQRPANPVWPFIGYGVPTSGPFVASGMDGSALTVAIHAYAETTGEGAETVGGEELAHRIAAAIVDAMGEGASLSDYDCPYPATAHFSWTGTQVIADGDAFHAIVSYAISVIS
jgi:hypothetical protein